MRRNRHMYATIAAAVCIGGLATGCGSDDAGKSVDRAQSTIEGAVDTATSAVTEEQTIDIPADPQQLAFNKTTADATAGKVTLRMENPSPSAHNIAIQTPDTKGEVVNKGGVSEITVDLPAGTYTYYCSVPGHLEAGMKGTLTVK